MEVETPRPTVEEVMAAAAMEVETPRPTVEEVMAAAADDATILRLLKSIQLTGEQAAADLAVIRQILESAVEGLAALTGGGGLPFGLGAPPSEGGFFSGE